MVNVILILIFKRKTLFTVCRVRVFANTRTTGSTSWPQKLHLSIGHPHSAKPSHFLGMSYHCQQRVCWKVNSEGGGLEIVPTSWYLGCMKSCRHSRICNHHAPVIPPGDVVFCIMKPHRLVHIPVEMVLLPSAPVLSCNEHQSRSCLCCLSILFCFSNNTVYFHTDTFSSEDI